MNVECVDEASSIGSDVFEIEPQLAEKALEKFKDWNKKSIDTLRFEPCPAQYEIESL